MKINVTFEAQTAREEKILDRVVKEALDPKTTLGRLVSEKKAKLTTSGKRRKP